MLCFFLRGVSHLWESVDKRERGSRNVVMWEVTGGGYVWEGKVCVCVFSVCVCEYGGG